MSHPPRIAVIGAGIAGLATSLVLGRLGVEATLYERAPHLRRGGGGLWLFGNAVRVFSEWGLLEKVLLRATTIHRYEIRDGSGRALWSLPLNELARRVNPPLLLISRHQLTEMLAEATEPDLVCWGRTCCGFVDSGPGVRPVFVEGDGRSRISSGHYDGLVGADGFRSSIRRQLLGPENYVGLGSRAWGGLATIDRRKWPFEPGEAVSFLGQGRVLTAGTVKTAGTAKTGTPRTDKSTDDDRRQVLWFASERLSRTGRGRAPTRRDVESFGARLNELFAATQEPACFPLRDRHPVRRWGRRRVTLLGDAAHPMTPDFSQGAAQALEGAATLARCLAPRLLTVPRAFRDYENRRRRRTAEVTRISRLLHLGATLPAPEIFYRWSGRATRHLLLDAYERLLGHEI